MSLAIWRDLAVVWLALLCFIGSLIPLVAFYFAVRGMSAVNRRVPPLLQKAQTYSRTARARTDDVSTRVAAPVMRARAQGAKWERVAQRLLHPRNNHNA